MNIHDLRYDTYFAYGASEGMNEVILAFDIAVDNFSELLSPGGLTQRGLLYLPGLVVRQISQTRRSRHMQLAARVPNVDSIQELGLYVFDQLSFEKLPSFLANLHLSYSGRFGSVPVLLPNAQSVRWFAMVSVDRRIVPQIHDTLLCDAFTRFCDTSGGAVSGIFRERPFVWRGVAGLDWMYRELTQTLVNGDITRFTEIPEQWIRPPRSDL